MNTPDSPAGTPRDFIYIPEHLRSRSVYSPGVPGRVWRLLKQADIRLFGDLHGKRLSDFQRYCGRRSEAPLSLKRMILDALYPGGDPSIRAWPISMSEYRRLDPTIHVPPGAYNICVKDLPLSARLQGIFGDWGIDVLGQLDGRAFRQMWARRNCGSKTLAEFKALMRRVEAGEFGFLVEDQERGQA